ncbi:hypothetical protein V6615_13175 [Oscillospiraceae bacterium PP1C4]
MSLNSEPIPENEDLLRLIDAGIAALQTGEDIPLELTAEQIQHKNNGK